MAFLAGGPKALRREIDRRLDYVAHIRHEPPLTCDVDDPSQLRTRYRVAAVEEIRCVQYVAKLLLLNRTNETNGF